MLGDWEGTGTGLGASGRAGGRISQGAHRVFVPHLAGRPGAHPGARVGRVPSNRTSACTDAENWRSGLPRAMRPLDRGRLTHLTPVIRTGVGRSGSPAPVGRRRRPADAERRGPEGCAAMPDIRPGRRARRRWSSTPPTSRCVSCRCVGPRSSSSPPRRSVSPTATASCTAPATRCPVPSVVRLTRFVRVPYRTHVGLSRRAIFARDGWRCAYCRGPAETIDHVMPRSRGGRARLGERGRRLRPVQPHQGRQDPRRAGLAAAQSCRPPRRAPPGGCSATAPGPALGGLARTRASRSRV